MIVVLTNSKDATADFLEVRMRSAGLAYMRWNTDRLTDQMLFSYRSQSPHVVFEGVAIDASDVAHVWYRRPERIGGLEVEEDPELRFTIAEWTEAISGFLAHVPNARWMNHPSANAAASAKIRQLSLAREVGLSPPDTLVTQDHAELLEFSKRYGGRLIAKPMSAGRVRRPSEQQDSLIYTNEVPARYIEDSRTSLNTCPTMFQELVQKQADIRITYVDGCFISVSMTTAQGMRPHCDIRRDNMRDVIYTSTELPSSVEARLGRLVEELGLRFAAIDMAVDHEGGWRFFEVNPNGQWAWLDQVAGTDIASAMLNSLREE